MTSSEVATKLNQQFGDEGVRNERGRSYLQRGYLAGAIGLQVAFADQGLDALFVQ